MAARRRSFFDRNCKVRTFTKFNDPLDECFVRGIINDIELDAGIKLRHLYSQRYGNPILKSNFPKAFQGRFTGNIDENNELKSSALYIKLLGIIKNNQMIGILLDVCIYLKHPSFLNNTYNENSFTDLKNFREAIKITSDFLCSQNPKTLN